VLSVVGDDRDRLSVVPGKHSRYWTAALRLEGNAITDSELKHVGMCPHLIEKTEALHDSVVQVDEFSLG